MKNLSLEKLLKKVEELKASGNVDLSTEEDLSIAIMNLISLEEHFYFTSQKTGKDNYLGLMKEIREVRKSLLARMISRHEGETWCISKHLLATTMRLIEVGTKLQSKNKPEAAKDLFNKAYRIYSMFWLVRFKLLKADEADSLLQKNLPADGEQKNDELWTKEDILNKLIDCCGE